MNYFNFLYTLDAFPCKICTNDKPEAIFPSAATIKHLVALFLVDQIECIMQVCLDILFISFFFGALRASGGNVSPGSDGHNTISMCIPPVLNCI